MKKIFIDTDLGGDCDDVGAIALANILNRLGECELIGMTHTTSSNWGPACIDIINGFYGNHIPLGATMEKGFFDGERYNTYAQKMAERFPSIYRNRSLAKEAVSFMRETLAQVEDGAVTMVFIGQLNNLARLLASKPDAFSNLSGISLVKQKVTEVVIMGGLFKEPGETIHFAGSPYEVEYNIISDLKSSQEVFKKLPVPTVCLDFKAGYLVKTGGPMLLENDLSHPVTFAYRLYSGVARESWDPLAVYYAIRGENGLFTKSALGDITVSAKGETLFALNPKGRFHYLKLSHTPEETAHVLDDLLRHRF